MRAENLEIRPEGEDDADQSKDDPFPGKRSTFHQGQTAEQQSRPAQVYGCFDQVGV